MAHDYLMEADTRPATLQVNSVQLEHTMKFVLSGELDLSNAATLEDVLSRALENRERANAPLDRLIIDLRNLGFIDSCGIQALISTKRSCDRRDIRLSLKLDPESQVRRVLHLVGVAEFLGLD